MDYPVVHTVGQMEMDIGYLYTDGKRNHKTATRPEPSLGQIGLHRNLSHRIFPASPKYSHNTGPPTLRLITGSGPILPGISLMNAFKLPPS